MVEFLNETMDPVEVLALEVRQYVGEQHKALVPRVFGQTASAQRRKGASGGQKTNKEAFLKSWDEPGRGIYSRLLDFADAHQLHTNWGVKGFSMNVVLEGQNVSMLEGYPPIVNQSSLLVIFNAVLRKIKNPDSIVTWYRDELKKLSVIRPTAKGMRCSIAETKADEERRLHEILDEVVRMVREHGLAS